jgi:thiamine-phosphate pyrophosphorylase
MNTNHGSESNSEYDRSLVFRIVDANLNRCREALRVVEDGLRFGRQIEGTAEQVKSLRQEVGQLARAISTKFPLIMARDVAGDPGTAFEGPAEYVREGLMDVLQANLARAGEALRSIEEYSKCLDSEFARIAESVRYRLYVVEQDVIVKGDLNRRLDAADLCVLIDVRENEGSFSALAHEICSAGAGMIQLRDKQADDRTLLSRAKLLAGIANGYEALAVVNDRVDIAVAAGAHGVHLGQEDLPVAAARKAGGNNLIIGVSTHSVAQAEQAVTDGASYIGVGPVFDSTTKSFDSFGGVELVRVVANAVSIPAFAIGGITLENINQVAGAGPGRVAVSGGVLRSDCLPGEACRRMRHALRSFREPGVGTRHD